jgi:zinc protease
MKQVKIHELSNGTMLYCFPDTSNVSGIGFSAGSIYDPPGKKGLAHAVEHTMCRRSRRYPDVYETELRLRRYLGKPDCGTRNIRTDHTSVFYGHGNLPRRRYMYDVFDIMASFIHPNYRIVDPEGLRDVEIPAVSNEFRLYGTDWAPAVIDELLHQELYATNPARWRIDGEFDQVSAFTARDAKRFVERYYVPRNAFVIMLGPKEDFVKSLAERYFHDWNTPSTVPVLDYGHDDDVPKLSGVRSVRATRDIKQYHLGMAWPTEVYGTPDAEAIDVLANILETRAWRIREGNTDPKAGAYRAPVTTARTVVHGTISFWFATVGKDYIRQGEAILLEEIGRLQKELSSQAEFDVAIANRRDDYLEAFADTPGNLAEMIVSCATNGDRELKGIYDFRERLDRVTRRKVRDIANKYLDPKAYVRAVVGPGPA